ncbi:MAG: hypothetical protein H7X77_00050 [Anaerolineae bacterium]|nr:hypothetical protein [Anaerolineae bacterium]
MMTIKRWIFILLAGILLLPTLGAVAQDDNPIWLLYEREGLSLRVPPTWISLSDTALLEQTLDTMKESNPEMVPMLQQAETLLANNTISLFLVDILTQYNLNVAILPGGGLDYTLAALEAALPSQYATMGIDLLDTMIVELPVGEALQLHTNLSVNMPTGGTDSVGQYQYFFIIEDNAFVLTLTAPGAEFEEAEALFRRIANTIAIEEAEDAWTRYTDTSGTISLQAPDAWVTVEVAAESDFVLTLTRDGTAGATIRLTETELTLAELETELTASLDEAGIKIRSVERVFLPAGEFIRLQIVNAELPGAVEQYQYVTIKEGQQISVLFTANQDDFADATLIFEQLMDTLQVNGLTEED